MATFLSIVNAALARLGEPAIDSLEDQGEQLEFPLEGPATFRQAVGSLDPQDFTQSTVASVYPGVRDALLHAHPWSWLTTRQRLEDRPERQDEREVRPWPYQYRWGKPRTLIGNIRAMYDTSDGNQRKRVDDWQLQGPYVFTGFTPAIAEFQGDVGEPAYPALFEKALQLQLAAELAWPITQDSEAQRTYEQKAMVALEQAKSVDSQSHPNQVVPDVSFEWVEARIGGYFGRRFP